MHPFTYQNPTRVVFGRGVIGRVGNEAALLGSRILLVHGSRFLKERGWLEKILTPLRAAGLEVVEYGGVKPNPLLSHVREGIRMARKEEIAAIVAAGGGSVMDSAKAIAAGALVEHDVWQFFKGKKGIRAALPLICIPTLAGSGSEMNCGMVLTNEKTSQKFGIGNKALFPRVSLLDPEITCSVPPNHSAYGAVDAIVHLLEHYFTTTDQETPVQRRLAEGLIITVMESCEIILQNPHDYDARANIMWAAALALNGVASAGLGWVGFPMHMIEHSLSALYDIPHGAGLAAILPAWLRFQAETDPHKLAAFGKRIFNIQAENPETDARHTITAMKHWLEGLSCPTSLSELGIAETDIPAIAENALGLAKLWRLREYTQKVIEKILRSCE